MPLQNYQYDTIMREYSKTQSQNRRILEERTQEIYEKIPRIREIDEEVATLSARKARALLSGESSSLEDLKAAISLLSQERNALLVCNSYPEDYLSFLISVRSARIQAMWAVRNVPVLRKQRLSCSTHSPI